MTYYICTVSVLVESWNKQEAAKEAWEIIDEDHMGLNMEITEDE